MARKTAALSRHTDYIDTDARPVWTALASIPTPAALRGAEPNMEWLTEVEGSLLDLQGRTPRDLEIQVTYAGYEVYNTGLPIPVLLLTIPDPYAVGEAIFTGTLRVRLTDNIHAPDVWLVETDDGVWKTIMDNTGMGVGGECLVTGEPGFWAWVVPESGPTTIGSRVTFRRTDGAT